MVTVTWWSGDGTYSGGYIKKAGKPGDKPPKKLGSLGTRLAAEIAGKPGDKATMPPK